MTVHFRSSRKFQLWRYSVSHSQLLLQSNPSVPGHPPTRIEVLFKPVDMMKVAAEMQGLVIRSPTTEEFRQVDSDLGGKLPQGSQIYILESSDFCGYVVAATVVTSEDSGL